MNTYDPDFHLTELLLIGAGGTGAQLARSLARILYDMKRRRLETPHLTIIDPDTVSSSNIGRQPFTPTDIGKPKAAVLARRFNLTLGLDITAVVEPFDAKHHCQHHYGSNLLLIDCVDNYQARQSIAVLEHQPLLSLGNTYTRGQCLIGDLLDREHLTNLLKTDEKGNYIHLPHPYRVFPGLLAPEPNAEPTSALSCAQLVEQSTQHLLINDAISTIAAQYIYKILHRIPLQHWISFVDTDDMTTRSIQITSASLNHYARLKLKETHAA